MGVGVATGPVPDVPLHMSDKWFTFRQFACRKGGKGWALAAGQTTGGLGSGCSALRACSGTVGRRHCASV